jgi:hypothetical protein
LPRLLHEHLQRSFNAPRRRHTFIDRQSQHLLDVYARPGLVARLDMSRLPVELLSGGSLAIIPNPVDDLEKRGGLEGRGYPVGVPPRKPLLGHSHSESLTKVQPIYIAAINDP